MAKTKIKINRMGVRAMLNEPGAVAVCKQYASQVAQRAGSGYGMEVKHGKRRASVRVVAQTEAAKRDCYANNTLVKALGGGEG